MMSKVLIFDWAGAVKLAQYGYEHNQIVEADLHDLINFFLENNIKVMVSREKNREFDYMLCVDNMLFRQR